METIWGIISSATPYLLPLLTFLIFLEQITYVKKKSSIPGPSLILPFLGNAISLVRNPTLFWEVQSAFAKSSHHGVSANYIIGKFIVFIRSTDLSHKIFANVRPDAFHLVGHPFGKKLFGEHNLIYMMGQDQKDLRRRITPNFTPRALSTYTNLQQSIILKHLASWLDVAKSKSPESISLRILSRDMNLETSQKVFVGPYLTPKSRQRFNYDYNFFNVGLMKLPIYRFARFCI